MTYDLGCWWEEDLPPKEAFANSCEQRVGDLMDLMMMFPISRVRRGRL